MTTKELRALLARCKPGPYRTRVLNSGEVQIMPLVEHDKPVAVGMDLQASESSLFVAAVNALPALLDVVERVAKSRRSVWQTESDDMVCNACGAVVAMVGCMEYDDGMGEEFIHDYSERLWRDNSARIPHEPDCFFVAARKLRGGE